MSKLTYHRAYDEFENWYDTLTEQQLKQLQRAYSDVLKRLKKEISQYWAKYSKQGKIDYKEMMKYGRMDKMKKILSDELRDLSRYQNREVTTMLFETYKERYNYTGWTAEQFTGLNLNWYTLPKEAIKKALQNPISGLTLNEVLEKRRNEIILEIQQQVTQNVMKGEAYRTTAERLKAELQNNFNKAQRIVWTESHRVKEQASLEATEKLKDKGLQTKRMWDATLDSKTRPTHQELDGQVEDKDGYFHIYGMKTRGPGMFGIASQDINCRCTTINIFNEEKPDKKYIRGKGVSDYVTYKEWKEQKKSVY
jgi:SPP1 gp7 family putative phage head morphogenesis protein